MREDKKSKRKEVIYQSKEAKEKELQGIEKMLVAANIQISENITEIIFRLNQKFGEYHTLDMLANSEQLIQKCADETEEILVREVVDRWKRIKNE